MQYMLLIYQDEETRAKIHREEGVQIMGEYMEFIKNIQDAGQYRGGAPLVPSTETRVVKVRNGQQIITDGPFAETREQLAGYFVIEAASEEEALGIAARIPSARVGTIEVRPVQAMQMPAELAAKVAR